MPVRNEIGYISKAITSVLNQSTPKNSIEIIVADGNSTDGTFEFLTKISVKHSNIKVIQNESKIVSSGFNLALNQAKGKYILRVDGHCELPANYIENCYRLLIEENASICGGRIETISDGMIGNAIAAAQSSLFGIGGVSFRTIQNGTPIKVDTLAFGLHRRDIFPSVGGYDEEMICNQDDEFNFRIIQSNGTILLNPALSVKYYSRSNYVHLFKQYFNYGLYKVRGIQKRNSVYSIRHIIPSVFVFVIFMGIISGIVSSNWNLFIICFGLYSLLNFLSSIIISKKMVEIPFIFIATVMIHFAYGLGFLAGLLKFITKWKNNCVMDTHFDAELFSQHTNNLTNEHSIS